MKFMKKLKLYLLNISKYSFLINKKIKLNRRLKEKDIILSYINKSFPKNNYFLINIEWSNHYTNYLKYPKEFSIQKPPPINNNDLLIKLKGIDGRKVKEDRDYVCVNEVIWRVLHKIYGGGPTITTSDLKIARNVKNN